VIAELVEQDFKIAPVLFHWDTPLALFNEYGAWSDPKIVDDFFDYATFIIQRYDHLVDEWFVSLPILNPDPAVWGGYDTTSRLA
jgi:beta-glucosidase/6-phospho-beta-glucosidase/beta-galactosidase